MTSHIQAAESDDHPRCDWTETHTQLLNMGGFRLIDQHGIPTRLEHADIPASHIHILEIHPNEIDEEQKRCRSKGHYHAPDIVVYTRV